MRCSVSATELLVFMSFCPTNVAEAFYVLAAMLGAEVTGNKTLAEPVGEREGSDK